MAEVGPAQTRVALVIGNGAYEHAATLLNPVNDASGIAERLSEAGFEQIVQHQNLGCEAMRRAFQAFGRMADGADIAVVYYAGHGIEADGVNYLVPVDAKLESDRDVTFEAVSLDQVLNSVEGASRLRLVILDACRDNMFRSRMARSTRTRSIGRGLADLAPGGNVLVAYAAKSGTVARDGDGPHSPFAEALLEYLAKPGLEVGYVFRYVRDAVLKATGGVQEPHLYGSLGAEPIFLAPPEPEASSPDTDDIFISYSRVDKPLVDALAQHLEAEGYSIWWDNKLKGGERFRKATLAAIDAASAVIVLWSKASVESDWVYNEATRAGDKLIPMRVRDLDINLINPPFGEFHALVLEDRAGLKSSLARLNVFPRQRMNAARAPTRGLPPKRVATAGAPADTSINQGLSRAAVRDAGGAAPAPTSGHRNAVIAAALGVAVSLLLIAGWFALWGGRLANDQPQAGVPTRPQVEQQASVQQPPIIPQPPVGQPSPTQPPAAQPPAAQPSAAQPSPAQPSAAQPSAAQPSVAQSSADPPSLPQPSPAQPSVAQPSAAQPSVAQSSADPPSLPQPSPAQPSVAQPSDAPSPAAGQQADIGPQPRAAQQLPPQPQANPLPAAPVAPEPRVEPQPSPPRPAIEAQPRTPSQLAEITPAPAPVPAPAPAAVLPPAPKPEDAPPVFKVIPNPPDDDPPNTTPSRPEPSVAATAMLPPRSTPAPAGPLGNTPAQNPAAPVILAAAPANAGALGAGVHLFKECENCPVMAVVPAGRALIGSPADEPGRSANEGPQQPVTIGQAFAVGRSEVTFDEWSACLSEGGCNGHRPGDFGFGTGRHPVIFVSWQDAQAYVDWLSRKTGASYRLLSEAEWEFAARGCALGSCPSTPFWFGSDITPSQANYNWSLSYKGSPKAQRQARTVLADTGDSNPFGLLNVHGNVREWVQDCWSETLAGMRPDGAARMTGDCARHVIRGGGWSDEPRDLRSAKRSWELTAERQERIGFRVARNLSTPPGK